MTTTQTAQAKTVKKEKVKVPVHGERITDPAFRKLVVRTVKGTASSPRDENGKKDNRKHVLKYTVKDKRVRTEAQIIYGRDCLKHKGKNITELENSKGSWYYFQPLAK